MSEEIKTINTDDTQVGVPVEDEIKKVDATQASTVAESVIEMTQDVQLIRELNPKDVYDKKNKVIEEADIPLEDKLRYFDQNQDSFLNGNDRASDTLAKARENKVIAYGKAIAFFFFGAAAGILGYRYITDQSADEEDIEAEVV